jgi:hypothetical protein
MNYINAFLAGGVALLFLSGIYHSLTEQYMAASNSWAAFIAGVLILAVSNQQYR